MPHVRNHNNHWVPIGLKPDFLILPSFFSDFIPMGQGVCQKVYPCCYCQKPLPSPSALREHELIHTGEKPFNCEVCGKGFTRKRNKKAHMIMHLKWRVPCTKDSWNLVPSFMGRAYTLYFSLELRWRHFSIFVDWQVLWHVWLKDVSHSPF